MKITRKFGDIEVEIDTDKMTKREKAAFFAMAALRNGLEVCLKITGKNKRESKKHTEK